MISHVVAQTWNLFRDDESTVLQRLARLELVVVEYHVLVAVAARIMKRVDARPVPPGVRQAIGQHIPQPFHQSQRRDKCLHQILSSDAMKSGGGVRRGCAPLVVSNPAGKRRLVWPVQRAHRIRVTNCSLLDNKPGTSHIEIISTVQHCGVR
eukprot:SAG31_NODE_108_length_24741_cov_6.933041_15_plen_152_part_00